MPKHIEKKEDLDTTKVWVEFDKTMGLASQTFKQADKTFVEADKIFNEFGENRAAWEQSQSPSPQKPDKDPVIIPLTLKNRIKMLKLIFSKAKFFKI